MASWMSHIRLAGELIERIPDLDAGQFAIGNIAPDAGVPDADWRHFDPPPEVTHYRKDKTGRGRDIHDLEFYRQFQDALDSNNADIQQRSFLLGYFFHLLTDHLFDAFLWDLKGPQLPFDALTADRQFVQTLRQEWRAIDQIYVRDHPDAFYWAVFTTTRLADDYLPFLPASAIQTRVELLQDIYQRDDEQTRALYAVRLENFSVQDIDRFIAGATGDLHQIYQAIWVEERPLDGMQSAVQLLPA